MTRNGLMKESRPYVGTKTPPKLGYSSGHMGTTTRSVRRATQHHHNAVEADAPNCTVSAIHTLMPIQLRSNDPRSILRVVRAVHHASLQSGHVNRLLFKELS